MKRTALLVTLLLLAGCGGAADEPGPPVAAPEADASVAPVTLPEPAPGARCAAEEERLGSAAVAYAATVRSTSIAAFARPRGERLRVFGYRNVNGVPTVFGVLGVVRDARCRPAWYHVQLPMRPNGATGFVRAEAARLHRVRTRIHVDLSERRIDFFRDGRLVLSTTAAIGSGATPTPLSRYYVNQRLLSADPSGPFGPGAIGISAFSPVLTGWTQGGPIAIHGTNNPSSIGEAVSNGCLRVRNDVLTRLFEQTPAGTPVIIRA